jgi:hypothetical protein
MCHLIWLLSRKYGTVWYHPENFKLWYLTALSFVNFQEKLTGTSFALCACEASFVRLALCLALSALFTSTDATSADPRHAVLRPDHRPTAPSRPRQTPTCLLLVRGSELPPPDQTDTSSNNDHQISSGSRMPFFLDAPFYLFYFII